MADFITHFSIIPDPRVERTKKYPLIEILFLCMSAVVASSDGWEEIEDFGKVRIEWLRKFLPFTNGIPCHDIIARVMSRLDAKALQSSFISWMQDVFSLTEGKVIVLMAKQFGVHSLMTIVKMLFIWSVHGQSKIVLFWDSRKYLKKVMK